MSQKILAQEEEIKKQIVVYTQQTKLKAEEEVQLESVLGEYKKKHDEFSKAMKKSRETFKVYEGEIKNMNQRALELTQMKKKLLGEVSGGGGGKKKGKAAANKAPIDLEAKEAEVQKLQGDWINDKEALLKEKTELMQVCKELQDTIKALKEGKA